MLQRLLCIAAVVVSLAGFAQAGGPPEQDLLHVVGPYTSGNLSVYLVRGPNLTDKKYLTLAAGLEQKKVIVREKRAVNELTVENLSDQDLYLQAGEIVKGGQQDRTLGRDMVVTAHSGEVPIGAHCVEHGRWTQRGDENVASFGASKNALASKGLKEANYAQDQQAVWDNVAKAQKKLQANAPAAARSASPSSFELTVEDKAVTEEVESYKKGLEKYSEAYTDTTGFFFAINGKLNSGEVYASADLFNKMYPKLLHAAAVEALSERDKSQPNKVYDAPKPEAVEAIIRAVDVAAAEAQPLTAVSMERAINRQMQAANQSAAVPPAVPGAAADRTEMVKKQTKECVMYESRDTQTKTPFLHRAYLTK